jgi:hypothetical protein
VNLLLVDELPQVLRHEFAQVIRPRVKAHLLSVQNDSGPI